MRRAYLTVLVVTLGVFLLTAGPVSAVSVSGDFSGVVEDTTDGTFVGIFSAGALLSTSDSSWSFGGGDFGTLSSASYSAMVGGTTFFAYVYQLINDPLSNSSISGLTVSNVFEIDDALDLSAASNVGAGGDPVFVIKTDDGADGLPAPLSTVFDDGFGTTDIARILALPTPKLDVTDFTVNFLGGLAIGAKSLLFGFISIIEPAFVTAVVLNGGGVASEATLVTTAPEPATVLLLGSGLLGLLGAGRIRRRRRRLA